MAAESRSALVEDQRSGARGERHAGALEDRADEPLRIWPARCVRDPQMQRKVGACAGPVSQRSSTRPRQPSNSRLSASLGESLVAGGWASLFRCGRSRGWRWDCHTNATFLDPARVWAALESGLDLPAIPLDACARLETHARIRVRRRLCDDAGQGKGFFVLTRVAEPHDGGAAADRDGR